MRNDLPAHPDPEMQAFEQALLLSIAQAKRGEGRVTTGAEIARRAAGRPTQSSHKQPVTLRIEPDALTRWRASGKGWQTRAAAVLAASAP
jgi:uncharacterized protein (DUF4415 family)